MKMNLLVLMFAVSLISAQTVSISGTVSNISGQPLQGVIVRLIASQMADTSDANGAYSLSGVDPTVVAVANRATPDAIRYANGVFTFHTSSSATVSVKLFDLRGAMVATIFSGRLGRGINEVPFTFRNHGNAMYVMKITGGQTVSTYKIIPSSTNASLIFGDSFSGSRTLSAKIAAFSDWLQATKLGYASQLEQLTVPTGVVNITMAAAGAAPDFGPNVLVFDPSMNTSTMQSQLDAISGPQQGAQFGSGRYAWLFKPGSYNLDVNVGFYTEALGLGLSPDSVQITGQVQSSAAWMGNNATCTFWKGCAGICVTPSGGTNTWAASQAAPIRRMHIKGIQSLSDGGWSSGGFIADSKVDGTVNPGSQQQYFSRNDNFNGWGGGGWNYTFVGCPGGPTSSTQVSRTVVTKTPVIAEKPFLAIDKNGNYFVLVPDLRRDSTEGVSWDNGATAGTQLPIDLFYITTSTDNAASINAALSRGKNILFTPGHYTLESTVNVTRPGTVVLGIGFPTFAPANGNVAMKVSDVDGARIAGLLFEGAAQNSPVLLEIGDSGSTVDHSKNPTCLYDIFCRAGGQYNGLAACFVKINSSDVIFDHTWLWRADHGAGAGWNSNLNANGLIVNGNNVTVYGLFVEHTQQYQTWWNGNNGRTFFYQSEMPYDPPDQPSWMRGTIDGYPSYKVSDGVAIHEAWGLGVYSVFRNNVTSVDALEVPSTAPGIKMHHVVTEKLGGGEITHVINDLGGVASSSVLEYP
jgi:hypothetical protein